MFVSFNNQINEIQNTNNHNYQSYNRINNHADHKEENTNHKVRAEQCGKRSDFENNLYRRPSPNIAGNRKNQQQQTIIHKSGKHKKRSESHCENYPFF